MYLLGSAYSISISLTQGSPLHFKSGVEEVDSLTLGINQSSGKCKYFEQFVGCHT